MNEMTLNISPRVFLAVLALDSSQNLSYEAVDTVISGVAGGWTEPLSL